MFAYILPSSPTSPHPLPTSSPLYILHLLSSLHPPPPPLLSISSPTPSPLYILPHPLSSLHPPPPLLSISSPTLSPLYILHPLSSLNPPPPLLSTVCYLQCLCSSEHVSSPECRELVVSLGKRTETTFYQHTVLKITILLKEIMHALQHSPCSVLPRGIEGGEELQVTSKAFKLHPTPTQKRNFHGCAGRCP